MNEAEMVKAFDELWSKVKFDPPTGSERIWDGSAWLTGAEFYAKYGQDEEC